MKKVLSIILCVAILFAQIPLSVFAENGSIYAAEQTKQLSAADQKRIDEVSRELEQIKSEIASEQQSLSEVDDLLALRELASKTAGFSPKAATNSATQSSGTEDVKPNIVTDDTTAQELTIAPTPVPSKAENPISVPAQTHDNTMIFSSTDESVSVTEAVYFDGGDGTQESPYLISTEEQLIAVGNDRSACYNLTRDIMLTKDWTPLWGTPRGDKGIGYKGVFDGCGYIIEGLNIPGGMKLEYSGLFAIVESDGEIKNIKIKTIEGGNTTTRPTDNCFGGLVGRNNGKITNCSFEGNESIPGGVHIFGGLVGENYGEINNCSVGGNISLVSYELTFGGLVGINYGTVVDSYTDCDVNDEDSRSYAVGGLVGVNGGTITGCHAIGNINADSAGGLVGQNSGAVSRCYSTGSVTGKHTGGLVSLNTGIITECFSTSTISGVFSVGGLVGRNFGTITQSYATGKITDINERSSSIGGLVGENSAIIDYCYAVGNVISLDSNNFAGGLVGRNQSESKVGSVGNSYYDMDTTGQNDTGKGEGKSTVEMSLTSTYAGWSYGNIWGISPTINNGYPYLLAVPPGSQTGSCPLRINFQFEGTENPYNGMTLTLINVSKGTSQSINITNSPKYLFPGLDKDDIYRITVTNRYGSIIEEMNNITLSEGINDVFFTPVLQFKTVSLTVKDKQGNDIASGYLVKWYDSNNKYISQGNTVSEMLPGTGLYYEILLESVLGVEYIEPGKQAYTVKDGDNSIQFSLSPIPMLSLTGKVIDDADNSPIEGAQTIILQLLNGKYPKTISVTSGEDGIFTAQIYKDKTIVWVAKTDYMGCEYRNLQNDFSGDSHNMGEIKLSKLSGPRITLDMSYTYNAETTGEQLQMEGFADTGNIEFSLFNQTQNKVISKYIIQYPYISILDNVSAGDVIKISAASRLGDFETKEAAATLDSDLKAEAMFDFVQHGKFTATVLSNANTRNLAIVYNAADKYVKAYDISGTTVSSDVLPDGNYRVVFIEKSPFLADLQNISDYTLLGLLENVDYITIEVQITAGIITKLENITIPQLDKAKLNYTDNSKTSFTTTKTKAVAGAFFTLRSEYEIKEEYKNNVSNLKVIFALPENCKLIPNSVLVGSTISDNYVYENGYLTVPLSNSCQIVRLCVTPSTGGDYRANAFLEFDLIGRTIRQPIGTVCFAAETVKIDMPEKTSHKTVSISGITNPYSDIAIFDNNEVVGHTKAKANGSWSTDIELHKPYTYSHHNIYADIDTREGVKIISETKSLVYDVNYTVVSKVTMINTAHPANSLNLCEYNTVFDFIHPAEKRSVYWYWPQYPTFTFNLEFENNNPDNISDVYINVWTRSGEVVTLPAVYDQTKDIYVASGDFDSANLPINVSVDYSLKNTVITVDMQQVEDEKNEIAYLMFDNDEGGYLNEILQDLKESDNVSFSFDENNREFNFHADSVGDCSMRMMDCSGISKEKLLGDGFIIIKTTDDGSIYYKQQDDSIMIANFDENTYMEYINKGMLDNKPLYLQSSISDAKQIMDALANMQSALDTTNALIEKLGRSFAQGAEKIQIRLRDVNMTEELRAEYLKRLLFFKRAAAFIKNAGSIFGLYTIGDNIRKLVGLVDLYNSLLPLKCPEAEALKGEIIATSLALQFYTTTIAARVYMSLTGVLAAPATGGTTLIFDVFLVMLTYVGDIVAAKLLDDKKAALENQADNISCCPTEEPNCKPKRKKKLPKGPDADPVQDPSGYVYEAVASNKVPGVTTTIYYKENQNDSDAVVWDAAEYQQDNPLTTDSNGMYAWDVPQGWWQVKYEKDGYQTAYSEWLPVPPPQVDINVGIISDGRPIVERVNGYEDCIEIVFDRYMQTSTLTADNVNITSDGTSIAGAIQLMNAEANPENPDEEFASKIRFVPSNTKFLLSNNVQLTVGNKVKSYTDISMNADYNVNVPINIQPQKITATNNIGIEYDGEENIQVSVEPGEAAKGKKIIAISSSPTIATVVAETTLDSEGKAEIPVTANMTGIAFITLTLDGTDVMTISKIYVALPEAAVQKAETPTSSLPSGEVEKNTQIQLTTATPNATIYYTTDGTCPRISPTRQQYTDYIAITKTVTIIAIASANGMMDSDGAIYKYTVKDDDEYLNKLTAAIAAVEKAEASELQADVDAARPLVNELMDADKTSLGARLDVVQAEIDYRSLLVTTNKTVERAEVSKLQEDANFARALVSLLKQEDTTVLNARLDKVLEYIDKKAYEVLQQSAVSEVAKAEVSKQQEDVDYARNLVNDLKHKDPLKAGLNARLDKVQKYIDSLKISHIWVTPSCIQYSDKITIVAKLMPNKKTVGQKKVTFKINGVVVGTVLATPEGKAKLKDVTIRDKAGNYLVTAYYEQSGKKVAEAKYNLRVLPEDAKLSYTGMSFVQSGEYATISVKAVQYKDGSNGELTFARVIFDIYTIGEESELKHVDSVIANCNADGEALIVKALGKGIYLIKTTIVDDGYFTPDSIVSSLNVK